jgi:hypothetical protein
VNETEIVTFSWCGHCLAPLPLTKQINPHIELLPRRWWVPSDWFGPRRHRYTCTDAAERGEGEGRRGGPGCATSPCVECLTSAADAAEGGENE